MYEEAKVEVALPVGTREQRTVDLSILFGDTTLKVIAKNHHTGNEHQVEINYEERKM